MPPPIISELHLSSRFVITPIFFAAYYSLYKWNGLEPLTEFIGLENYEWLWDDGVFWTAVFNTLLYTTVASAAKFVIGLYLALLLNNNLPFRSFIRSIVLIPFIVPTVLSAIAFWWIFDSQFSIIS